MEFFLLRLEFNSAQACTTLVLSAVNRGQLRM
jgi:hypothetical protein